MKVSRIVIAGALLFGPACSSFDLGQVADLTSAVDQVKNGKIPSTEGLGKVDVGTAVSAGMDMGKALTLSEEEIKANSLRYPEHMDHKNRLAPSGTKWAKRLARLTNKHLKYDSGSYNFKVYLSSQVNAFALPDGSIRVYAGLLDRMKDDEVLFVIGHEIGHVKLGHSADKMRLGLTASGLRKGTASMNNVAGAIAASQIGGYAEKFINAQFSQDKEREADSYGLTFLEKNGYDPMSAVRSLKVLAALEEKHGADSEEFRFLASHPAAGRRAIRIAKVLDDKGIKVASKPKQAVSSSLPAEIPAPSAVEENIGDRGAEMIATPQHQATLKRVSKASEVQVIDRLNPGWYLQLCAEEMQVDAENKVAVLRSHGYVARVQKAVVHGTPYFRVLVGPYFEQESAVTQIGDLRTVEVSDQNPWLRRIAN